MRNIPSGRTLAATVPGRRQGRQRGHELRLRVHRRQDHLQQVPLGGVVRRVVVADLQLEDGRVGQQAAAVRLAGRRRDPKLLGVLHGVAAVLFHEGRRVLRAVVKDDGHGQRVEERWRDD